MCHTRKYTQNINQQMKERKKLNSVWNLFWRIEDVLHKIFHFIFHLYEHELIWMGISTQCSIDISWAGAQMRTSNATIKTTRKTEKKKKNESNSRFLLQRHTAFQLVFRFISLRIRSDHVARLSYITKFNVDGICIGIVSVGFDCWSWCWCCCYCWSFRSIPWVIALFIAPASQPRSSSLVRRNFDGD